MARKKQQRLEEVYTLPNVFRFDEEETINRFKSFFNDNPVTLEVGCGHGDYSVELAGKFPGRNFAGLDVRATRVYIGAKKALEEKITNVAFLVARADQLPEIFSEKKVEKILIPFPDSLPRRRDASKRLISENFINIYKQIITPGGIVHFKTDDKPLYDFALKNLNREDVEIMKAVENLHEGSELSIEEKFQTLHEKVFVREGRIIKYIKFRFTE